MRSAHTQRCHEPKACTSPATALYFPQNKQPQRQQGDHSKRLIITLDYATLDWGVMTSITVSRPRRRSKIYTFISQLVGIKQIVISR